MMREENIEALSPDQVLLALETSMRTIGLVAQHMGPEMGALECEDPDDDSTTPAVAELLYIMVLMGGIKDAVERYTQYRGAPSLRLIQ